jgi:hypothetical protein
MDGFMTYCICGDVTIYHDNWQGNRFSSEEGAEIVKNWLNDKIFGDNRVFTKPIERIYVTAGPYRAYDIQWSIDNDKSGNPSSLCFDFYSINPVYVIPNEATQQLTHA